MMARLFEPGTVLGLQLAAVFQVPLTVLVQTTVWAWIEAAREKETEAMASRARVFIEFGFG